MRYLNYIQVGIFLCILFLMTMFFTSENYKVGSEYLVLILIGALIVGLLITIYYQLRSTIQLNKGDKIFFAYQNIMIFITFLILIFLILINHKLNVLLMFR